jgi:integrase
VFPSLKVRGRVPLTASIVVADYLRPAAKKAGAQIEDGHRFGLHNLRHSLSNWLMNKQKSNRKPLGNPASRKNSDDARSVHARRQR